MATRYERGKSPVDTCFEIVKNRFELVILAIVFLSVLPTIVEIGREWVKPKPATPAAD